MPDLFKLPLRMNCKGINVNCPIDRVPPDYFSYLFNVRVTQEGWIEGRPGYVASLQLVSTPNSIRRLNDPTQVYAPSGYTYIGGGSAELYAGIETAFDVIDSGYSSLPLSLIPFRPNNSPESWMYVYDRNKQSKVRPDGTLRAIGVVPPSKAPSIEYAPPATVTITDAQTDSGWSATGGSSSPATFDRTNSSGATIGAILYNSGSTGWCCINPSMTLPQTFWMGSRMKVILNGAEHVLVRDVLPAIATTTVAGISYDSGTNGLCSMTLVNNPSGLARNSLLQIGSDVFRVLEVIPAPTGSAYSIRCSTGSTHSVGNTVTGLLSWYVYTVGTHVATETITSGAVSLVHTTAAIGAANFSGGIDAQVASNGASIDPANDYLHISLFLQNPQNVINMQILVSLDSTPNFSFTSPGNSWIWTIPQIQLVELGSSGDSWCEIVIPISSGTQYGGDYTLNFSNITGIAIQMTSSGACSYGFDWWYFFGTYGPTIQPNSPTGLIYYTANRDSSTGAHSVPGPGNRQALFPLREGVIITPVYSTQAGVDSNDIYRLGGAVTSPLYVATTPNSGTYLDSLPDSSILETNQPPDLTALQPWPLLQAPWSGTCSVVGTSIQILTGSLLGPTLEDATAILINGQTFLTYGLPIDLTHIQLTQDAGTFSSVSFLISSPTITGQPLPFAFGALEGPFAPVVFALGDPVNGGLLYYSNYSDADSANDSNTLEVTSPSNNLVSGAVWKGIAFCGSREEIFTIQYSYLATIGAAASNQFQWRKLNAQSGIWSRWACCACPVGVAFLGTDGIYLTTDSQCVNITDEELYPLFPHDGQPATAVTYGNNVILPVDMTALQYLRLSYCDETLRFSYPDIDGNWNTLEYQIYHKRWFLNNYADAINFHYLVENSQSLPNQQEILQLSVGPTNQIMLAGGNTDNGAIINSIVLTPSDDGKDERAQKLYVDSMIMFGGTGTLSVAATYNSAQSYSPVMQIACNGTVQQTQQNISSLSNLALYLNIGSKFSWTGGPAGPRIAAWEPSGFMQPYLSQFFVTQYILFSFPGWKHMRRMYPAIISNNPILMTIMTQDGRTYGPFTIASTGGQFRVLPQMLPQNIKDLAFALQLDGQGFTFAFFPADFTVEVKQWTEESYINLAVFKS